MMTIMFFGIRDYEPNSRLEKQDMFSDSTTDTPIEDIIAELALDDGFSNRDVTAFTMAYGLALSSDWEQGARVGAVITYRGRVVGCGVNSKKSDPMQRVYNRRYREFQNLNTAQCSFPPHMDSIHAEIAALKSIPYTVAKSMSWNKAKLYVYRIAPGLPNKQGLARPCPACMHAIQEAGIRTVYYSTQNGFAREAIL